MNLSDDFVVRNWLESLTSERLNNFNPNLNSDEKVIKKRIVSDLVVN